MSYYVYIHEFPNGKRYIGATVQKLSHRFGKNGSGYKEQPVYDAIQEFGWKNVKHYFYTLPEDKNLMYALERFLIEHFETMDADKGYNCESGGNAGKKYCAYRGEQQSARHTEYMKDPEHRKFISETTKRGMDNPELREYLASRKRGKPAKNRKKVVVDGVVYDTVMQALEKTGLSTTTFYKRVEEGTIQYVHSSCHTSG